MNNVQLEKSSFSIKDVRLIRLNFSQKKSIEEGFSLNLGIKSSYTKTSSEEGEKLIALNIGVQVKLEDKEPSDCFAIMEVEMGGIFCYEQELDKKLLPNLASILYSYIRPIVAQTFAISKLPSIDIPILNLSNLKIEEILSSEDENI